MHGLSVRKYLKLEEVAELPSNIAYVTNLLLGFRWAKVG